MTTTGIDLAETATSNPLFASIVATAFAYEGWIIATSVNSELKNAKRNLPIALVAGGLIIVIIYIAYYIGVAGGVGEGILFKKGKILRKVPEDKLLEELKKEIDLL